MPVDLSKLQSSIDAALAQATVTEGVEASAVVVIQSIGAQIKDAVEKDNTIDQTNTNAVAAIVDSVVARFAASSSKVSSALTANAPPAPPPV